MFTSLAWFPYILSVGYGKKNFAVETELLYDFQYTSQAFLRDYTIQLRQDKFNRRLHVQGRQ